MDEINQVIRVSSALDYGSMRAVENEIDNYTDVIQSHLEDIGIKVNLTGVGDSKQALKVLEDTLKQFNGKMTATVDSTKKSGEQLQSVLLTLQNAAGGYVNTMFNMDAKTSEIGISSTKLIQQYDELKLALSGNTQYVKSYMSSLKELKTLESQGDASSSFYETKKTELKAIQNQAEVLSQRGFPQLANSLSTIDNSFQGNKIETELLGIEKLVNSTTNSYQQWLTFINKLNETTAKQKDASNLKAQKTNVDALVTATKQLYSEELKLATLERTSGSDEAKQSEIKLRQNSIDELKKEIATLEKNINNKNILAEVQKRLNTETNQYLISLEKVENQENKSISTAYSDFKKNSKLLYQSEIGGTVTGEQYQQIASNISSALPYLKDFGISTQDGALRIENLEQAARLLGTTTTDLSSQIKSYNVEISKIKASQAIKDQAKAVKEQKASYDNAKKSLSDYLGIQKQITSVKEIGVSPDNAVFETLNVELSKVPEKMRGAAQSFSQGTANLEQLKQIADLTGDTLEELAVQNAKIFATGAEKSKNEDLKKANALVSTTKQLYSEELKLTALERASGQDPTKREEILLRQNSVDELKKEIAVLEKNINDKNILTEVQKRLNTETNQYLISLEKIQTQENKSVSTAYSEFKKNSKLLYQSELSGDTSGEQYKQIAENISSSLPYLKDFGISTQDGILKIKNLEQAARLLGITTTDLSSQVRAYNVESAKIKSNQAIKDQKTAYDNARNSLSNYLNVQKQITSIKGMGVSSENVVFESLNAELSKVPEKMRGAVQSFSQGAASLDQLRQIADWTGKSTEELTAQNAKLFATGQEKSKSDDLKNVNSLVTATKQLYSEELKLAQLKSTSTEGQKSESIAAQKKLVEGLKQEVDIAKGKITSDYAQAEATKRLNVETLRYEASLAKLNDEGKKTNLLFGNVFNTFLKTMKTVATAGLSWKIFSAGLNATKQAVQNVKELDLALTEVAKVTDLTQKGIEELTKTSFELSKTVGRTGKDVLDAYANFSRAGMSENAKELSEVALVLQNVGDGVDSVDASANIIISTLKGFKYEASEAGKILDVINEVSNTSAISFDDLSEGLTRTSAVFNQNGTTIEQLSGILTGANEVLQNIEKSSSGLITISQRLQGITEIGEDGFTGVSKLSTEFQRLAGIKIFEDDGGIRSSYEILSDMARIFPELDETTQAYLGNLAAGKRQISVLQSLLGNWESVEEAVENASNSAGSATAENEKFMNSIAGLENQLNSELQSVSANLIDDELVKSFYKAGIGVAEFTNSLISVSKVTLPTVAVLASLSKIISLTTKAQQGYTLATQIANATEQKGIAGWIARKVIETAKLGALKANTAATNTNTASKKLANASEKKGIVGWAAKKAMEMAKIALLKKDTVATNENTVANAANTVAEEASNTVKLKNGKVLKVVSAGKKADTVATNANSVAQAGNTAATGVATLTLSNFTRGIWANITAMTTWLATNPVGWFILLTGAIMAGAAAYEHFHKTTEEHMEDLEKSSDEYTSATSQMQELNNKVAENEKLKVNASGSYARTLEYENEQIKRQIENLKLLAAQKKEESLKSITGAFTATTRVGMEETFGAKGGRFYAERAGTAQMTILEELDFLVSKGKSNTERATELREQINGLIVEMETAGLTDSKYYEMAIESWNNYIVSVGGEATKIKETVEINEVPEIFSDTIEDYIEKYRKLEEIKNKLSSSQPISIDELRELEKINPELARSLQSVAGGWVDNEKAVESYFDKYIEQQRKAKEEELSLLQQRKSEIESSDTAGKAPSSAFLEGSDESLKEYRASINDVNEAIQQAQYELEILNGVVSENEKNTEEAADNAGELSEAYKKFDSALDDLQSQYEIAKTAQEEYNNSGKVSIDTYQSLLQLSPAMLNSLINEQGQISLNRQEWDNATIAQARYVAQQRISDILTKAENTGTLAGAIGVLAENTGLAATNLAEQNKQRLESIRLDAIADSLQNYTPGVSTTPDMTVFDNMADYIDNVTNMQIAPPSVTSPLGGGGGGGGGGSSDDPWKNEFEKLYDDLQHRLDLNLITEQQYTDQLEILYKKYFSDLTKYQEEYRKYEKEVYDSRQDLFDDYFHDQEHQIDLLSKQEGTEQERIDIYIGLQEKLHKKANEYRALGLKEDDELIQDLQNSWWDYQGEIDSILEDIRDKHEEEVDKILEAQEKALEKAVEEQEKVVDNYKISIEAAVRVIDGEIDRLNAQKEALQKANEEKEKAIELEKLQQNLENAKNQKNIRTYDETKGFYWVADQGAIVEAEEELEDFKFQEQLDSIDEQIDAWEAKKEAWNSLTENYENEQDDLIALEVLGADYESEILSGRLDVLTNFADDYISQLEKLKNAQAELNSFLENKDSLKSGLMGSGGALDRDNRSAHDRYVDSITVDDDLLNTDWHSKMLGAKSYGEYQHYEERREAKSNALGLDISGEGDLSSNKEIYEQVKGNFSSGGIANFTGLANLHGTPTRPEVIFNYDQFSNLSRNFEKMISPNFGSSTTASGSPSYNFNNVTIKANNPTELFSGLKQYAITHSRK